jgi:hypothetical protein
MLNKQHSGELVVTRAVAWTADDTKPLNLQNGIDFPVIGYSVNTDNNIAIRTKNQITGVVDPAVTIAVKAGIMYPISPEYIMATNTTATGITVYG